MMDYEVDFYRAEKERLQAAGYSFEITDRGYSVRHGDRFVSGAGTMSSGKRRSIKMKTADLRDYLGSAVRAAEYDETKQRTT